MDDALWGPGYLRPGAMLRWGSFAVTSDNASPLNSTARYMDSRKASKLGSARRPEAFLSVDFPERPISIPTRLTRSPPRATGARIAARRVALLPKLLGKVSADHHVADAATRCG